MKKSPILLFLFLPFISIAQQNPSNMPQQRKSLGFGLKGGLNFANVSNTSDINGKTKTGFMIAGFLSPQFGTTGQGFRSELVFSRQGYNFKTNTSTGDVTLDYILFPQLYTFNLGKVLQLQVGGQVALLIRAEADSTQNASTITYAEAMDYYNRLDYGLAAGFELYPARGLLIGARYNLSFAKTYKEESEFPLSPIPAFVPPPGTNGKNNVVQLFVGYKF